jgi:hypothetical protein
LTEVSDRSKSGRSRSGASVVSSVFAFAIVLVSSCRYQVGVRRGFR